MYIYSISMYLQLSNSRSTHHSAFNRPASALFYRRLKENFFIYHLITSFKGSHGICAVTFSSLWIIKLLSLPIMYMYVCMSICRYVYLCSELINLQSMASCSAVCCQLHEIIAIEFL